VGFAGGAGNPSRTPLSRCQDCGAKCGETGRYKFAGGGAIDHPSLSQSPSGPRAACKVSWAVAGKGLVEGTTSEAATCMHVLAPSPIQYRTPSVSPQLLSDLDYNMVCSTNPHKDPIHARAPVLELRQVLNRVHKQAGDGFLIFE